MKMTFVTLAEYEPTRSVMSEESQTEPDLSFTINELFERMARGMPMPGNVTPVYYDDNEDIDNPDPTQRPGFDLADYTEEMIKLQQERAMREVQSNQNSEAKKDADTTNAEQQSSEKA